MLKQILGDRSFWTTARNLSAREWLRVLTLALALSLYMFRRLLHPHYQFVGNDSDITSIWLPRFRFLRYSWTQGEASWWNPYELFGQAHLSGPGQPSSLLSLLQTVAVSPEKGLDYALWALGIVFALTTTAWLINWRFSPLAATLAGLMLAGTGTVVLQMFAGHLGLYAALCLTSALALSLQWGLTRAGIYYLFPASLVMAALVACGDTQGTYMAWWVVACLFLVRAALGSPDPIPAPALLIRGAPPSPRPGQLLAKVEARLKAQEFLYTLLKLTLAGLAGGLLATIYWFPALAAGADPGLDGLQEGALVYSASPLCLLTLVIPHFFLGPGTLYSWSSWAAWEGQPGVGVAPLCLALLGVFLRPRRDLWLPATLALASLLLALGDSTPFYHLYTRLDPVMANLPVPSRMYFGFNLALALLLAWAVDALAACNWTLSARLAATLWRATAALWGLWLVSYFFNGSFELWQFFLQRVRADLGPIPGQDFYVLSLTRYSMTCLVALPLTYALARLRSPFRGPAVILILLLEITRFNFTYSNFRLNSELMPSPALAKLTGEKRTGGKLINLFEPLYAGCFGLEQIGEWEPAMVLTSPEATVLLQGATKGAPNEPPLVLEHSCWLNRILGIEFYCHAKETLKQPGVSQLYEGELFTPDNEDWVLVQDTKARPLIYLSRITEPAAGVWQMTQRWRKEPVSRDKNWNFLDRRAYARWDETTKGRGWQSENYPVEMGAQERVTLEKRSNDFLQVSCYLLSPATVIVNEAWSQDWVASVDGEAEECIPCQLAYNRGVVVDAGLHTVKFQYRPATVTWARRQSWIALVIGSLMVVFGFGIAKLFEASGEKS